jgi:hypothetical protein
MTAIIAAVERINDLLVYDVEQNAMYAVSCSSTVTGVSINAIAPLRSGGHSSWHGSNLIGKATRVNKRDEKCIAAEI